MYKFDCFQNKTYLIGDLDVIFRNFDVVGGCVNGYDGFSVHRYDFVRDLHDQKLYVGQNISDKVIKIVVKVQKLQDNGSPWGELLELLPE